MRQKIGRKPNIDSLCFTGKFSEVRFSPQVTMFFQHTDGSPYKNFDTQKKNSTKNLDTTFEFLCKGRMFFNKLKGLPTNIQAFRDKKMTKIVIQDSLVHRTFSKK